VLVVGIIVAVMVALLATVLLTRRVTHDDVHSVEGYHRSLHTLEEINAHPTVPGVDADSASGARVGVRTRPVAYPESAVRLAGTSTVRVTDAPAVIDPAPVIVPPVPLPSVPGADPTGPVTFDDDAPAPVTTPSSAGPPGSSGVPPSPGSPPSSGVPPSPGSPPSSEAGHHRDKAMSSINHRPRRLAAPAVAVACVGVLIVVLLVTGSHRVTPPHHHGTVTATRHPSGHAAKPPRSKVTTTGSSTPPTPTTQPPAVSAPLSSTASSATYRVSQTDFTLGLTATSGACWVDATNSTTGSPYFVGTLEPGQQQTVAASGPVTVVLGAPGALAASVNGTTVQLPTGFSTPFTMSFAANVPPSA
jgi:hypothetical protein